MHSTVLHGVYYCAVHGCLFRRESNLRRHLWRKRAIDAPWRPEFDDDPMPEPKLPLRSTVWYRRSTKISQHIDRQLQLRPSELTRKLFDRIIFHPSPAPIQSHRRRLTSARRSPVLDSWVGATPAPRLPEYLINSMAWSHMVSASPSRYLPNPKRFSKSVSKWLDCCWCVQFFFSNN